MLPKKFKSSEYRDSRSIPGTAAIVVVDDNAADVDLIQEAFREQGVSATLFVARDGQEGIQLFNEIDSNTLPCPDLIILDLNLPKRNGFEVLERIQLSSLCADKPVVMLSSSEARRDRDEAKRLGAVRYISKPSTLDEFLAMGQDFKELLRGT